MRFDFIGAEEIHSGELRISFTLRTPPVLDVFRVGIRDQTTATAIFGGLAFRSDGTIQTLESPTFVATYAPNQTLHIEYVYQVAANSYDLFINGVQKFDGRAQSSAMPDKGIGALQFGFPTSTGSDEWAVDDILVVRTPGLLNADFDDKPLGMQIGTGGASVGEPLFVQPGFIAKVQAGTFESPALTVEAKTNGTVKAARFGFLNNSEIIAGELRISFRVRTAPVMDDIIFSVREQGTFSRVFGSLILSSGTIRESGDIVGTFMPGNELFFEFRYAMDAGTYDLFINRVQVVQDRSHGVTDGRGIGSIMLYATSSTASQWVFDDIYVYQPNDLLFKDGFD